MLSATGLGFAYGRFRSDVVLDGLDWTVAPGRRTVLLGPNGAGKSTVLKLLSGYLAPRRGSVTYDGISKRRHLHRHVAWMPQLVTPLKGLTVEEQVEYAGWVAGLSSKDSRTHASVAIEAVRLDDKAQARADALSGGQLRRLGLAQALVRRSDVLLLDEPTAGLDPAQTVNFREILRNVHAPGGIVVSTHQVSDLGDDVDHVAVIADGRLRFDGTVDEFVTHGRARGVTSGSLVDVFADIVAGGLH
ncbi:MAG: ATP-binding cassette domain-containing protein [Aeromicrobium sp.]